MQRVGDLEGPVRRVKYSVRTMLGASALALAIAMAPQAALAEGVTMDDLAKDAQSTNNVLMNGLGWHAQRYSPLKAINTETVTQLVPAWAFSFGGEKMRGQETQPLVEDGVMYVTGSYSRMYAIDTKTGHRLWEYARRRSGYRSQSRFRSARRR